MQYYRHALRTQSNETHCLPRIPRTTVFGLGGVDTDTSSLLVLAGL